LTRSTPSPAPPTPSTRYGAGCGTPPAAGTGGRTRRSALLKGARWALSRNPNTLTRKQRLTLAFIQITNKPLYRAYLLKEQFRELFAIGGRAGKTLLAGWLAWAARCRIDAFVRLAKRIRHHLPDIHATLDSGLSNARIEANNAALRAALASLGPSLPVLM
jgi:transposase